MGYEEIKEFIDKDRLTLILSKIVCSPCSEDDCTGCDGIECMKEIENQIYDFGIEHMETLAAEWGNV
jgi:hypothetical protein